MKMGKYFVICFLVFLFFTGVVFAHRPVIVKSKSSRDTPVVVEEPEISWAFYGILEGYPHYYKVVSEEPFDLYVNILVPDLDPEGKLITNHDMSFQILKESVLLFTAEGLAVEWHRFYEEYGRDYYYKGPEFEQKMGSGTYYVKVFNNNNSGKYSLAIGKIEKFNFFSIIGAMLKAKSLDLWFFQ